MRRPLAQLALLLALLPQLLLAGSAPALVLCQEASGARAVELSVSACCAQAPAAAGVDGGDALRSREDGCGDCLDDALSVSLQRSAAPHVFCSHICAARLSWELALQRWSAPASSRAPPPDAPSSPLGELSTLRLLC